MHIRVDYLAGRWSDSVHSHGRRAPVGGRQQPPIRSGVELVLIDAQVIDRQGSPVTSLQPNDFETLHRRKEAEGCGGRPGPVRDWWSAHDGRRPGGKPGSERRQFMLAVDEHSFAPGAAMAAARAAGRFIERLAPTDLVGLYTFPGGAGRPSSVPITPQSARALIVSSAGSPAGHRLQPEQSEIADISSGDAEALSRVAARECAEAELVSPRHL